MTSWWSKDRIAATVNHDFITRKLSARHRARLHSPVSFGQGLTDGTYLDWILSRSPRLFLILDDIGYPEHIFEIVDKSYDDGDLPLSPETITELNLANGSLEKKFAKRQNAYNVQELWEGNHVEYGDNDYVPVEPVAKTKGSGNSSKVDRVIVRNRVFAQRCMRIGEDTGIDKVHLVLHFRILQKLKHPHLVSVWATYLYQDQGFLLLQPSLELNLKAFVEDPPRHFKQLPRAEQCELMLQWIRCLASALAFLHQNGYSHQAIRPSNIVIDGANHIYLGAYQALGALEDQEPAYEKDKYEHAAPEQWQRKPTLAETNPLRSTLQSGGRTGHRVKARSQSSNSSSSRSSKSAKSAKSAKTTKSRLNSTDESASVAATAATVALSGSGSGSSSAHRNSRVRSNSLKHSSGLPSPTFDASALSTNSCRPSHTIVSTLQYKNPEPSRDLYDQGPYFQCDVFSMASVFIEVLSLLASIAHQSSKFSPSSLRSHLGKHNRTAGRGGAPADASFHANLRQTNLWLDQLSQADAIASSKFTSVFRKNTDKGKTPQNESEGWRCKGALGNLSDLLRPNVAREPKQRYTSLETLVRIESIYERWGIPDVKCCESISRSVSQAGRESMITALQVPRSTASSRASSNATRRPRANTTGPRPANVPEEPQKPDDASFLTFELGVDEADGGDGSDDSDAESAIIPVDDIIWPSPRTSRPSTSHYPQRSETFLRSRSGSTLQPQHPEAFLSSHDSQSTLSSLPLEGGGVALPRRSPSVLSQRTPPPSTQLPPTPAAKSGRWPIRQDSHPKPAFSASATSSGYAPSGYAPSFSSVDVSSASSATSVAGAQDEAYRPFWREARFNSVSSASSGGQSAEPAPAGRRGGARRRGMIHAAGQNGSATRYSVVGGDDIPPIPTRAAGHQAPSAYRKPAAREAEVY